MEAKAAVIRPQENEDAHIDSGDRDESSDVILGFIDDEVEVERPTTTRSGRAITRRSEIDFSVFFFQLCRLQFSIQLKVTHATVV